MADALAMTAAFNLLAAQWAPFLWLSAANYAVAGLALGHAFDAVRRARRIEEEPMTEGTTPRRFGGWGGVKGGRPLDPGDEFEALLEELFGEWVRADDGFASDLWGALSNVDWTHENGDEASYTFRAAGDVVAAIRGSGDYMDWYCSGPFGVVSAEIGDALAARGWRFKVAS